MEMEVYTTKRFQIHPKWYYAVEDFNKDIGDYGITLSYCEDGEVDRYITISDPDVAIAVGEAIIELASRIKDEA
jgi:hypothetical protein